MNIIHDGIEAEERRFEVDTKDILDSVKINLDNDTQAEHEETPTIQEVENEMPVNEDSNIQDKTQELYEEFTTFLKNKAEITPDTKVRDTIPTGIDLVDAILGGGFAIGAMSIIVGQPGSGKSMLAAQTLGAGQLKYQGDLIAAFLDSEQSTTKIRLANLGVRYPRINPYDDITVEKVFKFIEGLCLFKQEKKIVGNPSAVVWDSIANTLSQKEKETDDPNAVIGYKARLLSILVPKYAAKCAQHNICFLAVNQLRDVLAMGKFAPAKDLKFLTHSKDMPGGTILKFNAFQLVEMKVKSAFDQDGTVGTIKYGFDGFVATIKCVKNKLFPPNIPVEIVGSFTHGFSNFWTNYRFLVESKRIKASSWSYLISLPEKKFRTKDALNLYNSDLDFKVSFDKAVKEGIKLDIVDKYNPE